MLKKLLVPSNYVNNIHTRRERVKFLAHFYWYSLLKACSIEKTNNNIVLRAAVV